MAIPSELIVRLLIGIFSIPPILLLLRYYFLTRYREFLLFAAFFFFGAAHHAYTYVVYMVPIVLNYQVFYLLSHLSFLFLLFHSLQVLDRSLRNPLVALGVVWFSVLVIAMAFWELRPQPDTISLFIFELSYTDNLFHPMGASTIFADRIIYSTSHRLVNLLFYTYVCIVSIYAYIKADLGGRLEDVSEFQKLWVLALSFLQINNFLFFPGVTQAITIPFIPSLPVIFGMILVIYMILKRPGSFFISKGQVMRAVRMYSLIREGEISDLRHTLRSDELEDYLQILTAMRK